MALALLYILVCSKIVPLWGSIGIEDSKMYSLIIYLLNLAIFEKKSYFSFIKVIVNITLMYLFIVSNS